MIVGRFSFFYYSFKIMSSLYYVIKEHSNYGFNIFTC